MKIINIGLLGCGTVGTGVAQILINKAELLQNRLGCRLNLKYIADLDTTRDRGLQFKKGVLIKDAFKVVADPEIDIIVELIGGTTLARDLLMQAINNSKQVVTANKALLATQGREIFKLAAQNNIDLGFEASIGGCMPIIKTIREALVGNHITAMTGILNGTCNFILSQITKDGSAFDQTLKTAQEKGFAEADPSLDIEGHDTAHKLALLNALAYDMDINLDVIFVEGICGITPMDIEFARSFGYRIKLLAISKIHSKAVDARVHPTMIPAENLLSAVDGSLNAVMISGDAVSETMLYGHGAGMLPTASAVVSDIIDAARNLMSGHPTRQPLPMGIRADTCCPYPVLPIAEISTCYYFRFAAVDRPGVLSKIAGVLGEHNISIKSVQQKGRCVKGAVPIVMLTHLAKESDVQKALHQITGIDIVTQHPTLIRIEDALD